LRQVIGGARTYNAGADDHHPGFVAHGMLSLPILPSLDDPAALLVVPAPGVFSPKQTYF